MSHPFSFCMSVMVSLKEPLYLSNLKGKTCDRWFALVVFCIDLCIALEQKVANFLVMLQHVSVFFLFPHPWIMVILNRLCGEFY